MTHDPAEGIDAKGRIVTGVSKSAMQEPYASIVATIGDDLTPLLQHGLHGLYLYGSVATGQATPPTSDIDLYAVLTADVSRAVHEAVQVTEHRHEKVVREIGTSTVLLATITGHGRQARAERCFLRHYCVHLLGEDLRPDLPACMADRDVARGFTGDLVTAMERLGNRVSEVGGRDGRRTIAQGSRRLLMAAAVLLSVESDTWSTDRATGATLLAEAAPSLADEAGRVLRWAHLESTGDPDPLPHDVQETWQRVVHCLGSEGLLGR